MWSRTAVARSHKTKENDDTSTSCPKLARHEVKLSAKSYAQREHAPLTGHVAMRLDPRMRCIAGPPSINYV